MLKNIRTQLRIAKARIAYAYAKTKAQQLNRFNGKRYFILMTDNGKLMVMDKDIFYNLRHRNIMPKRVTPRMLTNICVWYSPGTVNGRPSPAMHKARANKRRLRYINYIRNLK